MKISTLALSLPVLALSFSASAMSTFNYAPTEFKTQAGVAAVYQRIEEVARSNCRTEYKVSRSLKLRAACNADIVENLVEQINNPRLTALHTGASQVRFAQR